MEKMLEVHIGQEIKTRFDRSGLTQREFGARIGMHQQNVCRVFNNDSIDTKRLALISRALKFNFFSLYCDEEVTEVRQAGRDYVERGKITHSGTEYAASSATESDLREQIAQLKSQLADKERIIQLLEQK